MDAKKVQKAPNLMIFLLISIFSVTYCAVSSDSNLSGEAMTNFKNEKVDGITILQKSQLERHSFVEFPPSSG
jgi:hypothetical protein